MEVIMLLTALLGMVAVQIILSNKDSAWPGYIMPVIMFLLSFLFTFSMQASGGVTVLFVLKTIGVWLLANIPTGIMILIYLAFRGKLSRRTKADANDNKK